jgi:TrmH family RNA methyltransferase
MKPETHHIRTRNDEYQLLAALQTNRKKRSKQGRFIVEGVRSIDQLRANGNSGWKVDAYVYSKERELSGWAREVLDSSSARRHIALAGTLMEDLSEREESSELMAVLDIPNHSLSVIPVTEPATIVVVDRPTNPGNLGTLIRSCDALGVHGVAISGHAADLFDPRTIRAAAGSLFSVPVAQITASSQFEDWVAGLRSQLPKLTVVGSSAGATTACADHAFSNSTILVIGSERTGLSHAYAELCEEIVTIPMVGSASSLNVSCAASVLLYEIARQRSATITP